MTHLPAGPRFAPLQTFRFVNDPTALFLDCARRYGDPFTVPTFFGTLFVTATPEGIRDVFTADPDALAPFAPGPRRAIMGERSVVLLSGARHRRERKLLAPTFQGERMRAYGRLMQATTLEHAARLPAGEVRILDLTLAVALDVILRAVLGVQEPERVARFREAIAKGAEAMSPAILFFEALQRPVVPMWRRFRARKDALDALILEQIERTRAAGGGEDMLSLMLASRDEEGQPMSDDELRDELITMVVAGHETTGVALAWAMFFLHKDRRLLERLIAEIDALGPDPEPEAVARLPYLGAVCDETLRLRPSTPSAVPRHVRAPIRLCGHDIPPGTVVIAATAAAHLDPVLYPSPHTFRPERFLERKYSPFEYLPFGGGARRCLGAAFASYEMRLVLATLLSKHRFSLLSSALPRTVRRNVTFGPENGVPVRHEGARVP